MANTLNFGNGKWGVQDGLALAYNDENNNFKPLPFDFTRDSIGTYVDRDGLIKTASNNVPRVDFTDSTDGALLLEPARSNLYVRSNQFETTWVKGKLSVFNNNNISPEGNLNGYFLREDTSTGSHDIRQNSTVVSGLQYTYSVFVKKSDVGQDRNLSFYIAGPNGSISFNTTNGTFFSVGSVDSYSSEDYGDGWWRLQFTDTSVSTSFNVIAILNNGFSNYTGDGTSGIYIYGAQLEQGSYATSYIPTSGSTVTRVADACSGAGNDQVINSTEGVLYCEFNFLGNDLTTKRFGLSDGTQNNRLHIGTRLGEDNKIQWLLKVSNTTQFSDYFSVPKTTDFVKMAFLFKENDCKLYVNGTLKQSSTINTMFSADILNRLNFNQGDGTSDFYGNCKDLRVYNTALTDAELAKLTTT